MLIKRLKPRRSSVAQSVTELSDPVARKLINLLEFEKTSARAVLGSRSTSVAWSRSW